MRKRFGLLLAALAVFVLAFGGLAAAEEKVYVNGIDFGFPPFGFVDKDGKPTGFDVDPWTGSPTRWVSRSNTSP